VCSEHPHGHSVTAALCSIVVELVHPFGEGLTEVEQFAFSFLPNVLLDHFLVLAVDFEDDSSAKVGGCMEAVLSVFSAHWEDDPDPDANISVHITTLTVPPIGRHGGKILRAVALFLFLLFDRCVIDLFLKRVVISDSVACEVDGRILNRGVGEREWRDDGMVGVDWLGVVDDWSGGVVSVIRSRFGNGSVLWEVPTRADLSSLLHVAAIAERVLLFGFLIRFTFVDVDQGAGLANIFLAVEAHQRLSVPGLCPTIAVTGFLCFLVFAPFLLGIHHHRTPLLVFISGSVDVLFRPI